jgi:S-adenosylmethionine:tRNA ribosyltransferase-isomerase
MRVDEFRYELPEALIAQQPPPRRRDSRLLVLDGRSGEFEDRRFREFSGLLHRGDLLVLNDTRVVAARLQGRKTSGGAVEILLERCLDARRFLAQVRASKSPKPGTVIRIGDVEATVRSRRADLFELELANGYGPELLMREHGTVPLPPYIRRPASDSDRDRYQTVYARQEGAVAAPTAGLHIDAALLDELGAAGVEIGFLTLHVGAGTFQPVRCERIEDHVMHKERVAVSAALCRQVQGTRARGGRVVAVGTTTVRALETASSGGDIRPFEGESDLFLYPGCRFRCVDALLTNFHLPGSTLLMLVCAFAGRENVLRAYRHAVEASYRFFSFGDAMFVTPARGARG